MVRAGLVAAAILLSATACRRRAAERSPPEPIRPDPAPSASARKLRDVRFAPAGRLATTHMDSLWSEHLVTRPDGKAIFIGGDSDCNRQVDIFDAKTSTWTRGPDLLVRRCRPMMIALNDGGVLVIGGLEKGGGKVWPTLATFERLDPTLSKWTKGTLPEEKLPCAAHALPDGRVLLILDRYEGEVTSWLSDAKIVTWESLHGPSQRYWCPALGLGIDGPGRAYLFGVSGGSYPEHPMEVFDAATKSWSNGAADVPEARLVLPLGDHRFLRRRANHRHDDWAHVEVDFDVLDVSTWIVGPVFRSHRHLAARLPDQRVLLLGGRRPSDASPGAPDPTTDLYDPLTNTLVAGPTLPRDVADFAVAPLPDRRTLVVGGWSPGAPSNPDAWVAVSE